MAGSSRYGIKVLISTVIFLGGFAGFNWLADPYYLMGTPQIEGVNTPKTSFFFQLGMTKPYVFLRSDADSLILGSSRAGSAIDPNHPTLVDKNFYNFATPGARMLQIYQKLRSATSTREIKRLIVCVDFFAFNRFGEIPPMFAEPFRRRLPVSTPVFLDGEFMMQSLQDHASALLSSNTLRDSVKTMQKESAAASGKINFFTLESNGWWYPTFALKRNPLNAFRQTEDSYLNGNWFPKGSRQFSFNDTDGVVSSPFARFEDLLRLAHQQGIETTVIILPVHARMLETLANAGLWDHFEYWKRELVLRNEKVALGAQLPAFPLWDFNGYYSVATEAVSADKEAVALKWVYDPSHTHVNTGNRILDILAGRTTVDFGAQMNSANIDEILEQQRQLRDQFRLENPVLVASIAKRVAKQRKKNPWHISPLQLQN